MRTLALNLKGIYFDEIKAGAKTQEFRLCTDYWRKRLVGQEYDQVVVTRGYPAKNDSARRLAFEWRGFEVVTLTHPHFGPAPVEVFAINLTNHQGKTP
jgi:hypothetical protein